LTWKLTEALTLVKGNIKFMLLVFHLKITLIYITLNQERVVNNLLTDFFIVFLWIMI